MKYIVIAAIFVSFAANAGITEGGRGILFGEDHAFAVTAKKGWILDNQSAVQQGLHMVFYPKGRTWANSPVIIYGRSIPTRQTATIKEQVAQTVSDFRNNGSPKHTSNAKLPLTLAGERSAEVYHYAGDQWGNFEAAAYIQETDTINFLVFSAKTKEAFEKHLMDFQRIASSYQNLYTAPETLPTTKLDAIKSESISNLKEPEGKVYESQSIKIAGHSLADAMQSCAAYASNKEPPQFSYFVRIKNDGNIAQSYIFPTNTLSVCFNALMSNIKYPKHVFETFVLNIEMRIKP